MLFAGTYGGGVFRSADHGATWVQTTRGPLGPTHVYALAVNAPGHVFAHGEGLWRSKDNGDVWESVDSGMSSHVSAFTLDSDGYLYAATLGSGVFRSREPTVSHRTVAFLVPATLWVGLKNSDDQGTQFDLRVELYRNSSLISSGTTLCVTGATRNPNKAEEVLVPFEGITNGVLTQGDELAVKVLTRIGTNPDGSRCAGHANATGLRLYYDAIPRPSRFGAEITPEELEDYYLRSDSSCYVLEADAPTSPTAKTRDSGPVKYAGGNPWSAIGLWSMTVE
jgi:hypothetical protein